MFIFSQIKSHGPSHVDYMQVILNIPVAFKLPKSDKLIKIIDLEGIKMRAHIGGQLPDISFYQNNEQIVINHHETTQQTQMAAGETEEMAEHGSGDSSTEQPAEQEQNLQTNGNEAKGNEATNLQFFFT